MRYLVRERVFGIGDDFWVEDENGDKAFLVDGKALRLRETFELKDARGEVLVTVRKKLMSVGDAMRIERDGDTVATVRKKHFTPLREVYRAELPDGNELEIRGDLVGKEYDIEFGGERLARVSRKWYRVRDAYTVDVHRPDSDPALLIAVAVCVDRLMEKAKEEKDKEEGEGED